MLNLPNSESLGEACRGIRRQAPPAARNDAATSTLSWVAHRSFRLAATDAPLAVSSCRSAAHDRFGATVLPHSCSRGRSPPVDHREGEIPCAGDVPGINERLPSGRRSRLLHHAKPRTTWIVQTQDTSKPDIDLAVQGGVRLRELLALPAETGGICQGHVSMLGPVSSIGRAPPDWVLVQRQGRPTLGSCRVSSHAGAGVFKQVAPKGLRPEL